jgi:hypothetical protein
MTTHRDAHIDRASGPPPRLVLGLTGALLALLILNLAVFQRGPAALTLTTSLKDAYGDAFDEGGARFKLCL